MGPENAAKAVAGLVILLGLGLAGGDIRNFPAAINLIFGLALWVVVGAIGLAVVGGIIFLIVTRNRKKAMLSHSSNSPKESDFHLSRSSNFQHIPSLDVTNALESIDWYQFEKVIARLLTREGFRVKQLGGAKADGGVDLIAQHPTNGSTELIQCKFWKSWDLNLKTIRELLGARESAEFKHRAASATIYTLSEPTTAAVFFAKENNIRIVGRSEIETRLMHASVDHFPELLSPANKSCPRCDAPMVNRGTFWGCSNYGRSRCRGIIKIER